MWKSGLHALGHFTGDAYTNIQAIYQELYSLRLVRASPLYPFRHGEKIRFAVIVFSYGIHESVKGTIPSLGTSLVRKIKESCMDTLPKPHRALKVVYKFTSN